MVSNDDTSRDASCEIFCKIGICAISRGNNMATKNRIAQNIRRIRIIETLEAKSSKRKSLEQEKLERVGVIQYFIFDIVSCSELIIKSRLSTEGLPFISIFVITGFKNLFRTR